jgi:hypothetical protein
MSNTRIVLALFSSVAMLSACGGGDDAPAPPPQAATDALPDTANESAAGLKKYLVDLSKDLPDNKESLDIASFNPKTVDDAEPESLD